MTEGFAAHQHSSLVQLLPGLVLPADVHLALIPPPRPSVHPIIGDLLYCPGMGLVDGRGVLCPVSMNVGALMDVLPHLFLRLRVSDPLHDLLRILADDGAQALPAALPVPHIGKILPLEQPGVLEHCKPFFSRRRPTVLRNGLQAGDLRLDLRPGHQILSPQILQLTPAKPRPTAKFNQLVIIGFGEMPVTDPVPTAPLNVLPVSLWWLKIIFVVRLDAVELAEGLCLQLYRPGGKSLVGPGLEPFIDELPCAFQRGTSRMRFFDVLNEILCVLPIALVGVIREDLVSVRPISRCRLFTLPKGLHTRQAVIGLLVQVFRV